MADQPAQKPPKVPRRQRGRSAVDAGRRASRSRGGTCFLGQYRVVDEIGLGGMAAVHLARVDGPGGFRKWVAVKRIHRHLAEDVAFVRMFLDEARVGARISHPNVAQVFELGKDGDTYWLAMEYLHGEPLREVMRSHCERGLPPLRPHLAAKLVADAAEGLHAAHELRDNRGKLLGLVHRDVSPHNIFLTYDGTVKVVDFGIAKGAGRLASTRAGTLKGKLAYMSPEQVRGETVDRRTDVFALGVVLWELTTGRRLFRGESELETLKRVHSCAVPRPSTLTKRFPLKLEGIIMRALAKDRRERFGTARRLSRALQRYLVQEGAFVDSEEIGTHVRQVLSDRFRARESLLRWASEVTGTRATHELLSSGRRGCEPHLVTESLTLHTASTCVFAGAGATQRNGGSAGVAAARCRIRLGPETDELAPTVVSRRSKDPEDDAVTRIMFRPSDARLSQTSCQRATSQRGGAERRSRARRVSPHLADAAAQKQLVVGERRPVAPGAERKGVAVRQPVRPAASARPGRGRASWRRLSLRLLAAATTIIAVALLALVTV